MRHPIGTLALAALAGACMARSQAHAQTASAGAGTTVQDVVVTAQRPDAQTLIDRKVYTVARDLQSTTGTAADVLNDVPSVAVDADGNVSVRGEPNVTILIDGKPSAQVSGAAAALSLLQLPASEIERIEVLTSPPAQYKAEGSGGVINIITRKSRKPGWSGDMRASGGDHGRYLLGLDGAYNAGALKLSGGVGLRQDIKQRLTTTNRLEVDPSTGVPTQSAESIDEHFHRLSPSVNAAVDYALNERQSLGAAFSDRWLLGHRYFDQHDVSGAPDDPPDSISDRLSDGH